MGFKHKVGIIVSRLTSLLARVINKTPLWYPVSKPIINAVRDKQVFVNLPAKGIVYHAPNDRSNFRALSLFDKEPETLRWIDTFDSEGVLWDVGACVGTYSIYSAVTRRTQVVAVEPSVFNLEWLAKNVFSNSLQTKIVIIPLALSNVNRPQEFNMQVTEWGGSMSSFGVRYDETGKDFEPRFQYTTGGCRADLLMKHLGLPQPRYLKVDVDSIEHLVLEGFGLYLSEIESIAIENSRNSAVRAKCSVILGSHGFNCEYEGRANSIWRRQSTI